MAGLVTYSTDKRLAANLETSSAKRAHQVIAMNKKGEKPETLQENGVLSQGEKQRNDLLENESITRFDKNKKRKKKKNRPKVEEGGREAKNKPSEQPKQPRQGKKKNSPEQAQPKN